MELPALAVVPPAPTVPTQRECVLITAHEELGVMEVGFNEGPRIVEYQKSTRAAPKSPYCASAIHFCLRSCGLVMRPEWEFAAAARWSKEQEVFRKGQLEMYQDAGLGHALDRISMDGDIGLLYYPSLKRVGHCFMIVGEDDEYVKTIEWNTGSGGEREGSGCFMRQRDKEAIHSIHRPPYAD